MNKKHLLFVCTSGMDRSPCAANLFRFSKEHEAKFAGISPGSEVLLTKEAVQWADIIFTMEPVHQAFILTHFKEEFYGVGGTIKVDSKKRQIILLDINNNFKRHDRALEETLVIKLQKEGFVNIKK